MLVEGVRAGPGEEGPRGGVAAGGLVLEGEDSEVAQLVRLGCCSSEDLLLASWPRDLGHVS